MAAALPYIAAGGTILSLTNQRKAVREQRQARRIRQRAAKVQNIRNRIEALKARQQSAANAQVAGVTSGVQVVSAPVQAEIASLGGQFGSNVGFAQELQQLNQQSSAALENAAGAQGRAATFGTVADLSFNLYDRLQEKKGV